MSVRIFYISDSPILYIVVQTGKQPCPHIEQARIQEMFTEWFLTTFLVTDSVQFSFTLSNFKFVLKDLRILN